jgi:hypothetical protein
VALAEFLEELLRGESFNSGIDLLESFTQRFDGFVEIVGVGMLGSPQLQSILWRKTDIALVETLANELMKAGQLARDARGLVGDVGHGDTSLKSKHFLHTSILLDTIPAR